MSNRKPTTRRRTAKKSAYGSVWPWVLMLGVVAAWHSGLRTSRQSYAAAACREGNIHHDKFPQDRRSRQTRDGRTGEGGGHPPRIAGFTDQWSGAATLDCHAACGTAEPGCRYPAGNTPFGRKSLAGRKKRRLCLLWSLRSHQLRGRWQYLLDEGRENAAHAASRSRRSTGRDAWKSVSAVSLPRCGCGIC